MPVSTVDDCTKLQYDLNHFKLWCKNIVLNININKNIRKSRLLDIIKP